MPLYMQVLKVLLKVLLKGKYGFLAHPSTYPTKQKYCHILVLRGENVNINQSIYSLGKYIISKYELPTLFRPSFWKIKGKLTFFGGLYLTIGYSSCKNLSLAWSNES